MKLYAAVGQCGAHRVVWGIGDTPLRARHDAQKHRAPEPLEVHEITLEQAKRIANGDTAWTPH